MSEALLAQIRANIKTALDERRAKQDELDGIVAGLESEARSDLTEDETAKFAELRKAIADLDERRADLVKREAELVEIAEARAAADALAGKYDPAPAPEAKPAGDPLVQVRKEPLTYERNGANSYVRDIVLSTAPDRRDAAASDRLLRHAKEVEVELRANPNRTDGTGGEFTPPIWLVNDYVKLARAARVTADLCNKAPLPQGTDSINLPKVATGTATAIQTADGATVNKTDMTTSTVTASVKTIAGQQVFSLQLLEQSPINFDEVVFTDLIADYASKLDVQVLNGSGGSGQVTGILNQGSIGSVTYTDASPTVPELYLPLAQATNAVQTARFLPAEAVVMHPRRWNWMLSALDSSNRPLVVPKVAGPYMAEGVLDTVNAQGYVGDVLGLPIYVDPNMPTTLGGGTEDRIIFGKFSDAWLWEGPLRTRTLFETDANTLEVRLQVYAYVAFTAARYPVSFAVISGTGLAAPSGF